VGGVIWGTLESYWGWFRRWRRYRLTVLLVLCGGDRLTVLFGLGGGDRHTILLGLGGVDRHTVLLGLGADLAAGRDR
jgi:hypothetical protein